MARPRKPSDVEAAVTTALAEAQAELDAIERFDPTDPKIGTFWAFDTHMVAANGVEYSIDPETGIVTGLYDPTAVVATEPTTEATAVTDTPPAV